MVPWLTCWDPEAILWESSGILSMDPIIAASVARLCDRAVVISDEICDGRGNALPDARLRWQGAWRYRESMGVVRPIAIQVAWLDEMWGEEGDYAVWRWCSADTVTLWQDGAGRLHPYVNRRRIGRIH